MARTLGRTRAPRLRAAPDWRVRHSLQTGDLSPDGGFIAFADAGTPVPQIWIKNLAQGEPVRITSSDVAASHPTWSPKNDQIVFAERGRGLWSVPPLGGTARLLLDFGAAPRFSADGERLVFTKAGREIWTIRADGTDARRLDGVPMPWYPGALDPAFSRDGTSIVYFFPELGPNGDLWIVPSSGGTPRQLTHDPPKPAGRSGPRTAAPSSSARCVAAAGSCGGYTPTEARWNP